LGALRILSHDSRQRRPNREAAGFIPQSPSSPPALHPHSPSLPAPVLSPAEAMRRKPGAACNTASSTPTPCLHSPMPQVSTCGVDDPTTRHPPGFVRARRILSHDSHKQRPNREAAGFIPQTPSSPPPALHPHSPSLPAPLLSTAEAMRRKPGSLQQSIVHAGSLPPLAPCRRFQPAV